MGVRVSNVGAVGKVRRITHKLETLEEFPSWSKAVEYWLILRSYINAK